jgi:hypothetical protein
MKEVEAAVGSLEFTFTKEARLQALRWALANMEQVYANPASLLQDWTLQYG